MEERQFEVLVRRQAAWVLDSRHGGEAAARARGGEVLAAGLAAEVRLVASRFDTATRTFQDREIDRLGVPPDPPPPCRRPGDLGRPAARELIREALRDHLDQWRITPLELLHHPAHAARLQADGNLVQGAVQRAAIPLARRTGENLHQLIKRLYGLIDQAQTALRAAPAADGSAAALRDRAARADRGAGPALQAGLAAHLADAGDWPARLERLAALLDGAPPVLVAAVDDLLAECLAAPAALSAWLPPPPERAARIAGLIAAAGGAGAGPVAAGLAAGALPATRGRLLGHAAGLIDAAAPLADGDLMPELAAIGRLHGALTGDQRLDAPALTALDALERRLGDLLGPQSLGYFLARQGDESARVDLILGLMPRVPTRHARIRLARNLIALLDDDDVQAGLVAPGPPVTRVLERLAAWRRGLGDLPDGGDRAVLEGMFEAMGAAALAQHDLFGRLARRHPEGIDQALVLHRMVTAGLIGGGAPARQVRARMTACLGLDRFDGRTLLRAVDHGRRSALAAALAWLEGRGKERE